MKFPGKLVAALFANQAAQGGGKRRRHRATVISCESLEGRVTPAHFGIAHHAVAHLMHHAHAAGTTATTSSSTATAATATALTSNTSSSSSSSSSDDDCSSSSSSSSTAVSAAVKQLHSDILTIEQSSGVTVGQLASIASAFETLKNDGLSPSSKSALKSFENSLVTDLASGTTLVDNSTLLSQFEALYTSSPTAQETTDLTTAYDALATAVTSSNITSADITTINNDWSALLTAKGSTSTDTFLYFDLVTGDSIHRGYGPGGEYDGGGGGC
jgi:hypothetical protein